MKMINTHQLRLSYLKDQMNRLPHGCFGHYRGRKVVYVTYDPSDRTVSTINKRRYYTDTRRGSLYSKLVSEYLKLEKEYEDLLNEWKLLYSIEPAIVGFPLKRDKKPILSTSFFNNAKTDANQIPIDDQVLKGKSKLRSKNELIAVQALESMGYKCKTEVLIPDYYLFPDVMFLAPEVDKALAVELDGAMDDLKYYSKAKRRQGNYYAAGFEEFKDVLFFRMSDPYNFDLNTFKRMVELAIELNSEELMIWNSPDKADYRDNMGIIPGF